MYVDVTPAHLHRPKHRPKNMSSDRVIPERGGIILDDGLFSRNSLVSSGVVELYKVEMQMENANPSSDTTIHDRVRPHYTLSMS